MATLEELDRHWSIKDVFDANDAMDAMSEARARAESEAAKRK